MFSEFPKTDVKINSDVDLGPKGKLLMLIGFVRRKYIR